MRGYSGMQDHMHLGTSAQDVELKFNLTMHRMHIFNVFKDNTDNDSNDGDMQANRQHTDSNDPL